MTLCTWIIAPQPAVWSLEVSCLKEGGARSETDDFIFCRDQPVR